jgi:predicted deacylase
MLPGTRARIDYRHDDDVSRSETRVDAAIRASPRAMRGGMPKPPRDGGLMGTKQQPPSPEGPRFDVLINPPDLTPWLAGDRGIAGVITRESPLPGPHVVLLSLTHGNEFAGAIVLDQLLRDGLVPSRGRISFAFVNLAAFARFDPRSPTLSRFIDEDINRLWDEAVLTGPRQSAELNRAREIRPLIDQADVILDLHSMLWPSDPLILCGPTARGRELGCAIGCPPLVVADSGHANGPRLIDYVGLSSSGATAVLVEAGQHWRHETVDTAMESVAAVLRQAGVVAEDAPLPPPRPNTLVRCATVTDVVTARTSAFAFVRAWYGGAVIEKRNTVIAMDGTTEITTPYDDCLLVMPSLRPGRGHTAVRLARFE